MMPDDVQGGTSDIVIGTPERRASPLAPLRRIGLVRGIAILVLMALAVSTPGFITPISLRSLMTSVSLVGCVAVGMTFITISGNIMSFSLGATLSATTIVFTLATALGLLPAIAIAVAFSSALTALQGWVIGYFRANPIIVSMAALALIIGLATMLTGGHGVYPPGNDADILTGNVGPIPGALAAFLASVAVGQSILSYTRFGRNIYLVGSNRRAAQAAGLEPWRTIAGAYLLAGLFTAISAMLIAARSSSGEMQLGNGYEYQAISAVLVGGTAIQGGRGSVFHTLVGAFVISIVNGVLLLRGFDTPMQQLLIGVLVLGVIMLQWRRGP
jgi:ribose/xylose/arabinose/galactoside ABC-type transport system permease subunit